MFYSIILLQRSGGWILIYIIKGFTGGLSLSSGFDTLFIDTISNPYATVFGQSLFIVLTILVVAKGVSGGIEKVSQVLMPALFILFILLMIRSVTPHDADKRIKILFMPDFGAMDANTILYAMGQSFFSLSVGVSVMVTYSAYLEKEENIVQSAVSVTVLNVLVAVMAGVAIFPAVFAFGLKPDQGPRLLFNVPPTVFNQMPLGIVFYSPFARCFYLRR